jgi:general secretion pathway protein G
MEVSMQSTHKQYDSSSRAQRGILSAATRTQRGFTLIEILVVITVIAILASLVTPMVFRNVGDAKATAAKAQIELLGLALDTYRLHNDHYPSTAQGLAALITQPIGEPAARDWRGPYLKRQVPDDPWGRLYHYESPGATNTDGYDLVSFGRDGQPGGTGEDGDVSAAGPAVASGSATP